MDKPAKDYQNTRYSTLDQINTQNAKDLRVAWTFSTGIDHSNAVRTSVSDCPGAIDSGPHSRRSAERDINSAAIG